MVKVTLKGDVVKEFDNGITAAEVAKNLGMGLYKAACLCKINGEYADLRTAIDEDCSLEILTFDDDEEAKKAFQHVEKKLMQASAKGTFHKNTVARKISRFESKLNALSAK